MSNIFSSAGGNATFPSFIDFGPSIQLVFTGNAASTISVTDARYLQLPVNGIVFFQFNIQLVTGVFTTGADVLTVSLPVPSVNASPTALSGGNWNNNGTDNWPLYLNIAASQTFPALFAGRNSGGLTQGPLTNLTAAVANNGDLFSGVYIYQGTV